MDIDIVSARSPEQVRVVGQMFTAYAESLGIDLSFQNFAPELAELPGKYAPPHGDLLLAYAKNKSAVGCVALRPLPSSSTAEASSTNPTSGKRVCEMKRLYVSPAARGTGLGRLLAEKVVQRAKELGYNEMRLDTLETMDRARDLYRRLGFVAIGAYYNTPIAGTKFLSLDLSNERLVTSL